MPEPLALALEPLPPGLGLDVQFVEQLATDQCSGAAEVVPAARFDEIGKGLQVGIALDPQRKEIGAELVAVRAPEARRHFGLPSLRLRSHGFALRGRLYR